MTLTETRSGRPPLILPDSPDYDAARLAWNRAADLRPAAVCVATRVADVQAVLRYAGARGLRVAPQTTGHLALALGDLRDTILLRVALHDGGVSIDPIRRIARIRAGATWGDVVRAAADHGLAAMHGSSPSVGVTGYLLSGGLSPYGRAHGLAANHVIAFEVVTPDGERVRVDHDHEPDLFYALRGGGGSFAIVTAVELALLPCAVVDAGSLVFEARDAAAVLHAWREWCWSAPHTVTSTFRILQLPDRPEVPEPMRGVATVSVDAVSLTPADARALERRLRLAGRVILGGLRPTAAADVIHMQGDPEDPAPVIVDGMLLERLDEEALHRFLGVAAPGSPLVSAGLRHLGGAFAWSPPDAGAHGHLDGGYLQFGVGIPGASAPAAALHDHLDRYLAALAPWSTGMRSASFADRTSSLRGCLPPDTLARLARIRDDVDPGRVLRAAHEVPELTVP